MTEYKDTPRRETASALGDWLRANEERLAKPDPFAWRMPRAMGQLTETPAKELFPPERAAKENNGILSDIPADIPALDFEAFNMAISQLLYNTSRKFGNERENSGMARGFSKIHAVGETANTASQAFRSGAVVASLNDICRLAYGTDEPTTKQRANMVGLIEKLKVQDVVTKMRGKLYVKPLLYREVEIDPKTKAVIYAFKLHPIYSENISNYAAFPQDAMKRLNEVCQKMTAEILKLLKIVGILNRSRQHHWEMYYILSKLEMLEAHKANPTRTEKTILDYFSKLREIGLVAEYTAEREKTRRGRLAVTGIRFSLNEGYAKKAPE